MQVVIVMHAVGGCWLMISDSRWRVDCSSRCKLAGMQGRAMEPIAFNCFALCNFSCSQAGLLNNKGYLPANNA